MASWFTPIGDVGASRGLFRSPASSGRRLANVYDYNHQAQSFYEDLGFVTTVRKPLGPSGAP